MNAPDGNSPSLKPNRTIAIVSIALICLAIGVAGAYWKLRVASDEEDDEPQNVKFVVAFRAVKFAPDQQGQPKNRDAFVAALADNRVAFRHKMAIRDNSSPKPCDKDSLPDTPNITNPNSVDPCKSPPGPLMGQQVTQRVGFNNRTNLEAALAALEP